MKQREELSHLQESIRKNEQHQEWIHDTGNYIKILKKLIDLGQNERAGHVLEELNKELEKNVMTDYSDNLVLNALLSEKAYMAESQAVTFDVYVEPNLNLESIRDMDIISMLGNLIDNAVRGAGECADKREVRVRIFMQNEGNILVIKIDNDCVESIQIHGMHYNRPKRKKACMVLESKVSSIQQRNMTGIWNTLFKTGSSHQSYCCRCKKQKAAIILQKTAILLKYGFLIAIVRKRDIAMHLRKNIVIFEEEVIA
ncbi:MAG: GHKL domain-containing protein [Lachnospiraceae bacterium]|nr:GHKL domain-containing protein [Lachnospiraceae bacterium]